jgi:hypothetical protein
MPGFGGFPQDEPGPGNALIFQKAPDDCRIGCRPGLQPVCARPEFM